MLPKATIDSVTTPAGFSFENNGETFAGEINNKTAGSLITINRESLRAKIQLNGETLNPNTDYAVTIGVEEQTIRTDTDGKLEIKNITSGASITISLVHNEEIYEATTVITTDDAIITLNRTTIRLTAKLSDETISNDEGYSVTLNDGESQNATVTGGDAILIKGIVPSTPCSILISDSGLDQYTTSGTFTTDTSITLERQTIRLTVTLSGAGINEGSTSVSSISITGNTILSNQYNISVENTLEITGVHKVTAESSPVITIVVDGVGTYEGTVTLEADVDDIVLQKKE